VSIYNEGFYFWGPFTGPGPITYTFARSQYAYDVFLFDQDNFIQYQYDAQRPSPFQTNYKALVSTLDIETVKSEGPMTLDANTNYFLVVDNTYIGATAGTTNGAGQTVFTQNDIYYKFEGFNPGVGYSEVTALSGAASVSPSIMVAAAALLAAIMAL